MLVCLKTWMVPWYVDLCFCTVVVHFECLKIIESPQAWYQHDCSRLNIFIRSLVLHKGDLWAPDVSPTTLCRGCSWCPCWGYGIIFWLLQASHWLFWFSLLPYRKMSVSKWTFFRNNCRFSPSLPYLWPSKKFLLLLIHVRKTSRKKFLCFCGWIFSFFLELPMERTYCLL